MTRRRKLRAIQTLIVIGAVCLVSLGSKAVTVISMHTPPERNACFIIDPGHGGVDGGATSCTGKLESAFNLEIGLRLNDLLHFLGYQTRMIRTEDISIHTEGETIARKKISDLKERVRICNHTEGAMLLSIHQNTFPDSSCKGAQIFYPDTEGSEMLAGKMQENLIAHLDPGGSRSAKKAEGIYLLEHITCPGVLIECGFLSNPKEEAMLRSPEYQKELCCVIATTAIQFQISRIYANT